MTSPSTGIAALKGLEHDFKSAGLRTELRRGDMGDPIGAVLELRDGFGNHVDLEVPLDGVSLKFVSLEDFVAMKLFAGGPQDLADAADALGAALEPPNLELLRGLATRYGPDTARSMERLLADHDRASDDGLGLD